MNIEQGVADSIEERGLNDVCGFKDGGADQFVSSRTVKKWLFPDSNL